MNTPFNTEPIFIQQITLIAAMAHQRIIGGNNQMLWHLPEDFAFFKQYTLGKPIIMGRKTWDSLPRKPLPQRRNLVITRQTNWSADGAEVYDTWQNALAACTDVPEVMVIGGGQIYQQMLDVATDLRLTEIDLTVEGDAVFPHFSPEQWREVAREKGVSQNGVKFDFVHYQRDFQAA